MHRNDWIAGRTINSTYVSHVTDASSTGANLLDPPRLVTDEDRVWVGRQVAELNEKHFKEKIARVLGTDKVDNDSLINALRTLMFGDFMVPGADPKLYIDIKDQVGGRFNV